MVIPATALHWHDQGVIPPGRLFFQGERWFLAVELGRAAGDPRPASLCLAGDGQGALRDQGKNGTSHAYVLAPDFSWAPFVSQFPGTVPLVGHNYAPAALYTGTSGPAFWARAVRDLVAVNLAGIEVTQEQVGAERHPYFDSWEAHLTSDGRPFEPIAKLFEVVPAAGAPQ